MTGGNPRLDRRSFLAMGCRLGLCLATAPALVSACTAPPTTSVSNSEGGEIARLPRLPRESPDLDLLHTLEAAERYAVTLCSEASKGARLGDQTQAVVSSIESSHARHLERLGAAITAVGATPDPPRLAYSLPTPLGDERRASGAILRVERNLAALYAYAAGVFSTLELAALAVEMAFSVQTHVAGLEYQLRDCSVLAAFPDVEAPALFVAEPGRHSRSPTSEGNRATPTVELMVKVVSALVDFESAAADNLRRHREWFIAGKSRWEGLNRDTNGPSAPGATRGLQIQETKGCLYAFDAETGIPESPTPLQTPAASAVVRKASAGERTVDPRDQELERAVLEATATLLESIFKAHEARAAKWAEWRDRLSAEAAAEPPDSSGASSRTGGDRTAPILDVPPELRPAIAGLVSPTPAAGREQSSQIAAETRGSLSLTDAALPGDPFQPTDPDGRFDAMVEVELKSVRALAAAASRLLPKEIRSELARASLGLGTYVVGLVRLSKGSNLALADTASLSR